MSTTTFEQINRSCINNSSSKQLYTFSTSRRFPYNKQTLTSHTDFLPSSYSQNKIRPLSFSKSKKQLIFENQQQYKSHPSPDLYSSRSLKQYKSGISMAMKLKPFYYLRDQKMPGPTSYSARSFDRNNKSVSFSKQVRKLKYPQDNWQCMESPGPGPYLIETNKLKTILSNYKNVKQTKIINKKVSNLDLSKVRMKINNIEQNIRQKQKHYQTAKVISSFQNSLVYKKQKITVFDKQIKKSIFDIKNKAPSPSPANYQCFSQFANRNKPDARKQSKKLLLSKDKDELRRRIKTLPVTSPIGGKSEAANKK